jgi:peptidoglycan/xylan/chitin deacetylase (PgdA/CDA1 family)
MELLVITYHYIRDVYPEKGFYGITPRQFLDQVNKIKEHGYEFVSLEDLRDPKKLPFKSCLLTFDDGLKEHYEAYCILQELGIPGAFFVSMNPLYYGKALQVHKMHYILSQTDSKELLSDLGVVPLISPQIREQYPWGDENTAILKYLLYFILSEEQRKNTINIWFNRLYKGSENTFLKETYMNIFQVRELGQKGYLGTHTMSHRALATLEHNEIVKEVRVSKRLLELSADREIYAITYPFGGKTAVNNEVIKVCQQQGLILGFTIEKGINTLEDTLTTPLQLKRYDTINAYGGKYDELSRI